MNYFLEDIMRVRQLAEMAVEKQIELPIARQAILGYSRAAEMAFKANAAMRRAGRYIENDYYEHSAESTRQKRIKEASAKLAK